MRSDEKALAHKPCAVHPSPCPKPAIANSETVGPIRGQYRNAFSEMVLRETGNERATSPKKRAYLHQTPQLTRTCLESGHEMGTRPRSETKEQRARPEHMELKAAVRKTSD
jgi:hypothetical protein